MTKGVPASPQGEKGEKGMKGERHETMNAGGEDIRSPSDREGLAAPRGFQDLFAWQKGMDLVDAVYRETRSWPKEELHGLTAQVRKAAVAIPSNLAEGHGRSGPREFAHHASIAYGSFSEVETQLLIAARLGYMSGASLEVFVPLIADVKRLCRGLLRSLNDRSDRRHGHDPLPPSPPSPPERSDTP